MKTIYIPIAVALLTLAIAAPASAWTLLNGGTCNGAYDDNCKCGNGVVFCAYGEDCRQYYAGVCVQGL